MMLSQGPEELPAQLEDMKHNTFVLNMYEQFRYAARTPGGKLAVLFWDNYNLTEKFLSC